MYNIRNTIIRFFSKLDIESMNYLNIIAKWHSSKQAPINSNKFSCRIRHNFLTLFQKSSDSETASKLWIFTSPCHLPLKIRISALLSIAFVVSGNYACNYSFAYYHLQTAEKSIIFLYLKSSSFLIRTY